MLSNYNLGGKMNPKLELGDVQETALIPLACRALETKRKHPRIIDPMAVQIMQELHPDVKKYDKTITHECVVILFYLMKQLRH